MNILGDIEHAKASILSELEEELREIDERREEVRLEGIMTKARITVFEALQKSLEDNSANHYAKKQLSKLRNKELSLSTELEAQERKKKTLEILCSELKSREFCDMT